MVSTNSVFLLVGDITIDETECNKTATIIGTYPWSSVTQIFYNDKQLMMAQVIFFTFERIILILDRFWIYGYPSQTCVFLR